MATTKNNSISSQSVTTTSTTGKKARARTRQAPVIERVTAGPSVVVSQTAPAAPATSPDPTSQSAAGGSAAPGGTSVAAPPPVTIPAVPAGFVPVNPADLSGFRLMASQVSAVPGAISELQAFSGYSSVFGITAPDVVQLTQRLDVAYEWTMQLSQMAAWTKYAKSQQGTAWKDAVTLLDALKPAFDLASAANPALLNQNAALARLLAAKSVIAKRGASSRAKDRKAAAQTVPVAASGSGASAPTATPAPANTVTASPAPATVVASTNGAAAPAHVVPTQS